MASPGGPDEEISNLFDQYGASILRFAYAYIKNRSDAEDITQDVFVAFMDHAPHFGNEATRKAWLFKVARNKCKDLLKSYWRRNTGPLPDDLGYLPESDAELVVNVLALDEKYRVPIHLFYYEGYSINEIAVLLERKPSTIGTWLDRGRKLLKAALGDEFDG